MLVCFCLCEGSLALLLVTCLVPIRIKQRLDDWITNLFSQVVVMNSPSAAVVRFFICFPVFASYFDKLIAK